MFKKNNFFEYYFNNSKVYRRNIEKTGKVFKDLKLDIENGEIPLIESYQKEYQFDFTFQKIKKFSACKNVIIIGVGGSILGAKTIYSFLKKRTNKKLFFFDNLDTNLYFDYKNIKNIKNSCFVVVSKSGNTIETITNLNIIFSKKLVKNRLIIITELKDSSLMDIANDYNAEIIEHREFISGRYSALSEPGMLPAALMGLNLGNFKNLKKFLKDKSFVSALIKNVASIYTLNVKKIKNSIIISYDSDLNDLGCWYQQLVAESLGKKGKGINPSLSFGPKDHHSLMQLYLDGPKDKFFTFFSSKEKGINLSIKNSLVPKKLSFLKNKSLGNIITAQCEAVKKVFKLKKIPYREFIFNEKKEKNLGEILTFFVLETILLARLMKIDPFNQPAVELVKNETEKLLK